MSAALTHSYIYTSTADFTRLQANHLSNPETLAEISYSNRPLAPKLEIASTAFLS